MRRPPAVAVRRRIVRIATFLAAAVVVCLTVLQRVHLRSLSGPIASQLSAALGRPVHIRGDVHVDFALRPHLEVEQVVVGNAHGHVSPALAEIGRLELRLDLWRLLVGVLAIEALRVVDVDVVLAIDSEGGRSWENPGRGVTGAGRAAADGNVRVRVRNAHLENVRVHFADARSGRTWTGAIDRLSLSGLGGGPMTVELDGHAGGEPVALALRLDPPPPRPAARPYGVSFQGVVLGAEVSGAGTVVAPYEFAGVDVGISAALDDGALLAAPTGWMGGAVGPVVVAGRLTDADGSLGVDDVEVKAGLEHGGWVNLSGTVGDVAHGRDVSMTVRFGGDDLRALVGRAVPWLGRLGPFHGAAMVVDRDGTVDVLELVLTAGDAPLEVGLEGGIGDLLGEQRVDIAARVTAGDLASVGEALGLEGLPVLGPVAATGRIVGSDAWIGLSQLDLSAGSGVKGDLSPAARALRRTAGQARFRMTGGVRDLGSMQGIDVAVELQGKHLAALAAAFGTRAPAIGPVEVAGRVVGSAAHLVSDRLTVRFDQTLFRANVATTFADGSLPRIAVSLDTALLRLEDLGLAPPGRDEAAPGHDVGTPSGTLDRPLAWRALRAVEGTMRVHAKRAVGRAGLTFEEVRAAAELRGGVLEVRDLSVGYPGGRLAAAGRVDAAAAPPAVHITGSGTGVTLGTLTAQLAGEELMSGSLDFDVDLRTSGTSVQELLSGLDGEARLVVEGGSTDTPYSRAFVADIARALQSRAPDGEGKPINCLAGDFAIKEGVARGRALVVDAPDVTIVGRGIVDVGRRMLDLTLTPMLRDGGLFAPLVQVAVQGPFTDPVYTAARRSTLTTVLSHLLRVATSPLRALLPRMETGRPGGATRGACAQALEQAGT